MEKTISFLAKFTIKIVGFPKRLDFIDIIFLARFLQFS